MKLTIGFSPCPNDTFIFDALVNQKIDCKGYRFESKLEDVETLNKWALEGRLDISKVSFGVWPLIRDEYDLLNTGSALGSGVGPLLIQNARYANADIAKTTVAIPGENTTAHLLFSFAYPDAKQKVFLRYDEIEDFVLVGKGYGVIIHENRFTYQQRGLLKLRDLGEYWENKLGKPIPLGGIIVRKNLGQKIKFDTESLIRESIQFGFARYPLLADFVRDNAQEMSEDVMRKHIDLYVNNYSLDLGEEGRNAIETLIDVYRKMMSFN